MKKNIRSFTVLILSLALVSLAGCGRDEAVIEFNRDGSLQDPQTASDPERSYDIEKTVDEREDLLRVTVYVCGAVRHPGVYTLDNGSRIVDAIREAGGLSEEADEFYVNQAMVIQDGQKVYVPTHEEAENAGQIQADESGSAVSPDGNGMVNINYADEKELMTLPGIGQAKACLIIEYRKANGRFDRIEDIMKIKGIKEGMFNRIKDRICI